MRALITLILCSLFLSGCDHSPEPLRIGSNRWLGYAPIYIADENKWTTTANIHLVEYQTANGVTRGMHNGLLDAAFLTLDEAVLLQSTGHDIEIILVANLSAGADVLYATPDIRNLHDLKGKRVAVEGSTLGTYFLSHILDKAHLAIEDINIVNTPMYTHTDAFRDGTIDATVNTSLNDTMLTSLGALPLFSSRDLRDDIINVLVINRDKVTPQLRSRIRALWYGSLDVWLEDPARHDVIVRKRLGVDASSLSKSLDGIVMGDKALNTQYFNQGVLAQRIQTMQAYMLNKSLQKAPINEALLLPACEGDSC